ncbi:amino acid permease/ SLC12A domain-containing protein [Halteromyces radiatus]|uniref:amino acid permease/ SLC12A domain-containing protein n=1 Tax=Halteromyces radiatus TaxID=101107 RepID=UPI0022203086|nr:amino acid permease/ SLC12A domain-containing protein [Halteromyces radiatus]KAI8086145.1 amino acid permease/ SLC12A domain-containing protein [Halteromyces radiatus]
MTDDRLEEGHHAYMEYEQHTSKYESEKIEHYDGTSDNSNTKIELGVTPPTEIREIQEGTQRGLKTRHIQMIALGGCIGTGLFLNMGTNIATAGPAGAFIAYLVIGFMVYCVMTTLGEMASFIPVSGSFNHYATRFVDPALGFALGWNYWFSSVTIATEIAAAATIIDWWKPVLPDAAWSTIFMIIIVAMNLISVKVYGEVEYYFAMIKILIVIVFMIIAILVSAGAVGGNGPIGFKYWDNPGAFANGGVGTVSVLLSAGFSYQGTEVVGITAGEAKNPVKAIPRAIRNTFWRILIFYVVTIFLIGLCVPYDNELLANADGTPNTSAFTLVFELAGIQAGAHVINAIVLLSVLSAANASVYTTSRILLGLAKDGNGPGVLASTNRFGSPWVAVLLSSVCGFACCFVSIYSAGVAFVWFLSITTVTGFVSWWGIGFVHLRFRSAYVKQGRDVKELPYKSSWYPFSGLFSSILCILIILGQGYTAFTPQFDFKTFASNYVGLLPAPICYAAYKIVMRSKVVPKEEIDFETGRVTMYEIQEAKEVDAEMTWWRRAVYYFT